MEQKAPGLAVPAFLQYDCNMKDRLRKNDIWLIVAALLLAAVLWGYLTLTRRQGGVAVVTLDGTAEAVLPLSQDTAYALNSAALGLTEEGFANVIVVENGRVCVKEANCPDRLCVRQGWIRYEGESIVCLPHKLVVSIRGGESGMDAYTN